MAHKSMEDLKEMLEKELNEFVKKGELSAGSLEVIHKLTDTIKNIDKIEMFSKDEGYSERYMPPYYYNDGGSSYARRGSTYVRGYYRDGGSSYDGDSYDNRDYSNRRDSRGRYSRDDAKDKMMRALNQMMDDASTETERSALRRCISAMEND